jgi:hypothetical protein
MKKVAGVSDVHVSLNKGLTALDLKPGNTVTLAALRQIIKNNGFVPKDAAIVARGAIDDHESTTLVVSGTNERLVLTSAHRVGDDWGGDVRAPDKR